jgi:hypothetical protein
LQHHPTNGHKTAINQTKQALQPPLQRLYINTPFQPHFCSFLLIFCSFLLIRTAFQPHFTPFVQFVLQCFFPPNHYNARHIKHLYHFHARPHMEHFVILPVLHKDLISAIWKNISNFAIENKEISK